MCRIGQNCIYTYIRCMYGIFDRKFNNYTVIYSVYTYVAGA
jgi:hypothetical protein